MNITGKLLIVDDEQVIRHTLARILQSSGFEVTTAENAEQGLAFLETSTLTWLSWIFACRACPV